MKLLSSTLKLHIATWDDPGDYPSGAGSCALPSQDFVEEVTGRVVVRLEPLDIESMEGDLSLDSVRDWLADNPEQAPHNEPNLRVSSWGVYKIDGTAVTLTVEGFEADVPERDWDER